jgi:hypothetical protein
MLVLSRERIWLLLLNSGRGYQTSGVEDLGLLGYIFAAPDLLKNFTYDQSHSCANYQPYFQMKVESA